MRFLLLLAVMATLFSCSKPAEFKAGTWRGSLDIQGKELPFIFEVEKQDGKYKVNLNNVSEKIALDEVTVTGDSVRMMLHIFDAALTGKIEGDKITGTFVKYYAQQANMPFTATWGNTERFAKTSAEKQAVDFSGKYQLEFKTAKDSYPSVGVFQQDGNHLTGTFLTPTGDYRYLEGNVVDDQLMLSTFDGNHAFLFTATLTGDSLKGDYYSGKSSHETFKGIRNENAVMPDAESLTFLKEGYDKIDFSFPDVNGKKVSPADDQFKNKVVILQIFGTWCPNCMDETKFLTQWYNDHHKQGIEILGLAYERKDDFAYASERVKKMKSMLNVPYEFVIAGVNDKEKAAATLPMLNKVIAFPTTIFIGRDGKVKHIHTGFEGPGTGVYYEKFKERFNEIVNELLNEKIASGN